MEELLLHMIISGKYSQWKFQMVTDIKVSRFFMIGIVWSSPLIYLQSVERLCVFCLTHISQPCNILGHLVDFKKTHL